MSLPCPVARCDRPMPGGRRVCGACSAELLRDLRDVPSLARHLELAAARQTKLGDEGGRPQRAPEETELGLTIRKAPLPWDERARDAELTLHSTLHGWVRVLQDGVRPYLGPVCATVCDHRTCVYFSLGRGPRDTLAAMAVWLMRHRAQLLGRASADEAVDEIRAAIANARRTIDRPADRIYAGPCAECGTDMYARPGAPTVTCPVCVDEHGHRLRYLVSQLRDWMLAGVEDLLLPAPDVARALTTLVRPIAPALLYTWVARKRLAPRTTDGRSRALFRVGDVLELMQPSTPAACRDDQRGDML